MLAVIECCPRCLADVPATRTPALPLPVCPHCGFSHRTLPAEEYKARRLTLAARRNNSRLSLPEAAPTR